MTLGEHGLPDAGGGEHEVVVSAAGMVSPVGATAGQTFTSIRAGLRRMREAPDVYRCLPEDPRLDEPSPLVASAVYHLDTAPRGAGDQAEWLGVLAGHAFLDLVRSGRIGAAERARLAVVVAVPAGLSPADREGLVIHLHNHAEEDLSPRFRLVAGERTAGLAALEAGLGLLGAGGVDLVAVGGVDSYLFPSRLEPLDRGWRLLSRRNPDGFHPGEAAGFVLLERRRTAARRGLVPLAVPRAFDAARESAAAPGAALAGLLERLLPAAGGAPLLLGDLNGESARTREWGLALTRLGRRLPEDAPLEHPITVLGDVGAATGPILAGLAGWYLQQKHAARSAAVAFAMDDDGGRRGAVLARA